MTRFPALLLAGATLAPAGVVLAQAPASMTIEIVTEKRGRRVDGRSLTMTLLTDGDARFGFAVDEGGGELHTIFDADDNTVTTVAEGGARATVMPMPRLRARDVEAYAGEVEATAETKEILGYTATRYVLTSPGGDVTETWLAEVPGFRYRDLFGRLRGRAGARLAPPLPDLPDAVSLESHTTSRNGREVTHAYARALATGEGVDLGALEVPGGAEVTDVTDLGRLFGG